MTMTDFFISYTSSDKNWAEWIAWQLEQAGYTVVIQAWDFRSSGNFVLNMQKATTTCECTIAVLSPAYLESDFCQAEWAAAFAKDPKGDKGILLPVRIADFQPEGLLGSIVYIDLVGKTEEEARDALVAGANRRRAKPSQPPVYPGTKEPRQDAPPYPGGLPDIWNVPHRRNPNFTGREDLLAALEARLKSGTPAALTQALAGLGGVGKTQTALEYIYRHASEYSVVWWIRSEEGATLAADYAALAQPLQLSEWGAQDQNQIVAAVRRCLETRPGWLLVFDNAETQADLTDYLPRNTIGQIIITSRNQVFGDVAESLAVAKWEREESKAFLAKRTKRNDSDGANAIANELGDLPLALAQAAAYMEATGESYAGYLDLFQKRHQKIWEREQPPTNYPATVATTWTLSMEKAEAAAPGAAALMHLCAFFAPDDIPRDVLRDHRDNLPEPLQSLLGDLIELNAVLAALRQYSLLEVSDEAFDMHRLVQAVVLDRLEEEDRKTWCEAATRVVNAAYPFDSHDVRMWPVCARLTPHARVATENAEEMGVAQDAAARLLNQAGLYLQGRAEFVEAQKFYKRALKMAESKYGSAHPNVATCVNNWGTLLQAMGNPSDAQAHFKRALKIDEAAYGPDHPNVARDVNNLGMVLQELGDIAGAQSNCERALGINEKTYGRDHPEVARNINNLGMVHRALGGLGKAQSYYERALQINVKTYRRDHPEVGISCNNLGRVLQILGDLEGARVHFERALRIDEALYWPDHPAVARDVNNLGSVLRDLGELAGARAHLERALKIFRAFLGDDHPKTKTVERNLASLEE